MEVVAVDVDVDQPRRVCGVYVYGIHALVVVR